MLWVPEEYATAQELADDLRRVLADTRHKQRQWEEARRPHEEVLRQRRAVLTLIGGGVLGNPVPLIWDSILRAASEVEPLLAGDLDVVVNGRNLGGEVQRESIISAVREKSGALPAFSRTGLPVVYR